MARVAKINGGKINMKVELLHKTKSHGKIKPYYTFFIEGISRALLQELSRHRTLSPSVKSTRYTLKELKEEQPFIIDRIEAIAPIEKTFMYSVEEAYAEIINNEIRSNRIKKYLVLTGNRKVDAMSVLALDNLRHLVKEGISNDKTKYALPEAYKTSLTLSGPTEAFEHFIELRDSKAALWEIRELAQKIKGHFEI